MTPQVAAMRIGLTNARLGPVGASRRQRVATGIERCERANVVRNSVST